MKWYNCIVTDQEDPPIMILPGDSDPEVRNRLADKIHAQRGNMRFEAEDMAQEAEVTEITSQEAEAILREGGSISCPWCSSIKHLFPTCPVFAKACEGDPTYEDMFLRAKCTR